MQLLAIDPGFEKVGWAVFDKTGKSNTDFHFIASDLIKTSKSIKHELRLKIIYDALNDVLKKYNITCLVIEKLFFFKNNKTVLEVSQAVGVIELCASNHGLPITRLTPLEIKQTITGYGNADKKSIQKMIRLELGDKITFKDDDESDAIACGLAYCFLN